MSRRTELSNARKEKNDEFYTTLELIVSEIAQHPDMKRHFKDKVVLCNFGDSEKSNFVIFFTKFFKALGIKKVIGINYNEDGNPSYKVEYSGEGTDNKGEYIYKKIPLKGNGDFRSEECIEILKEADIVVTNPSFSLFREYLPQLVEYDKKFLILGDTNFITYREVFPFIRDNKLWLGQSIHSGDREIMVSSNYELKAARYRIDENGQKYINKKGLRWFTNLETDERLERLPLTKNYKGNEEKYPKYDNFDAIDVGATKDIPKDYLGVMGVPVTFMDKYCPEQFEILGNGNGIFDRTKSYENVVTVKDGVEGKKASVNSILLLEVTKQEKGKNYYKDKETNKIYRAPYTRILIRRKLEEEISNGN